MSKKKEKACAKSRQEEVLQMEKSVNLVAKKSKSTTMCDQVTLQIQLPTSCSEATTSAELITFPKGFRISGRIIQWTSWELLAVHRIASKVVHEKNNPNNKESEMMAMFVLDAIADVMTKELKEGRLD